MAAAYVQSKNARPAGADSATTVAVTFDNPVATNGLVVGCVTNRLSDSATVSVSDDKSNTYTVGTAVSQNDMTVTPFYLENIDNGPTVITVTFSTSTAFRSVIVHEASGVATSSALDQATGQAQAAPGTGTDAVSSGSVTTTTNGQYIFGATAVTNSFPASQQFTAGTGYTEREETTADSAGVNMASEDQIQTSAGSIAATFTQASGNGTVTHILTFKAAAATGWGRLIAGENNRLVRT